MNVPPEIEHCAFDFTIILKDNYWSLTPLNFSSSVPYKLRQSHSPHSGRDSRQCDVDNDRQWSCDHDSLDYRNRSDIGTRDARALSIPVIYTALN